jgi:hypothetical protein
VWCLLYTFLQETAQIFICNKMKSMGSVGRVGTVVWCVVGMT